MEGSDGILVPCVTWADFETNLKVALGTHATLGPNKSVFDIGDGQASGFSFKMWHHGIITCDWVGAEPDENLPAKVIIKTPSLGALRKMNDSLPAGQKIFDLNEAQWAEMEQEFALEGGQLCISYFDNSRTMNFRERHTVAQMKQIARALGKIHACSLQKEITSPQLQKDLFKAKIKYFSKEAYCGSFKGILAIDSTEKTKELMEKIDALACVYYGSNVPTSIHKQMGFRPVLVNGDLHTMNVLIDKDSGVLLALIDWQCAHLGVGVEDLHRIAMSAMTTEERRANMPMLVKEMHDSMVENLDGAEPPYTLETLLLVSDLVYPQCALFLAGLLIAFMTKNEKNASISSEEKAARREVMLDKVIGVLEDVVEIDANNNNTISNVNIKLVYD